MGCCDTDSDCGCVTEQWLAPVPCPSCGQRGVVVDAITPKHTLKGAKRKEVVANATYCFCENPECDLVYYRVGSGQGFSTADLINRVTLKDEHPDTRLCYCFKISKGEVLARKERDGMVDVGALFRERKGDKACFCDKSNPRGACCTGDINRWAQSHGIDEIEGCC